MRGFVPSTIFSLWSLEEFVQHEGMAKPLAKRLLEKQCLWLVRMSPETIAKIHEGDLMGRYSTEGQKLDIVELGAIYASMPSKFLGDGSGKKQQWFERMEGSLKVLIAEQEAGKLPPARARHPVYKNQLPMFVDRCSLHEIEDRYSMRESIVAGIRSSFSNLVSSFFSRFSMHALESDLEVVNARVKGGGGVRSKIQALEMSSAKAGGSSGSKPCDAPPSSRIKLDPSFAASLKSKIAAPLSTAKGNGHRAQEEPDEANRSVTINPLSATIPQPDNV